MKNIFLILSASAIIFFTVVYLSPRIHINLTSNVIKTQNGNTLNSYKSEFYSNDMSYDSYNTKERSIIDKLLSTDLNIKAQLLGPYSESEYPTFKDGIKLKYYDNQNALLFVSNFKGGYSIIKLNLNNSTTANYDEFIFGNIVENKSYLVLLYPREIKYIKNGEYDFHIINNSNISDNETYIKQTGYGDSYEASITSNILKVSVFRNENKEDQPNTKLKEIEFALP